MPFTDTHVQNFQPVALTQKLSDGGVNRPGFAGGSKS
jgi:hypothetical protein